MKKNQSAQEPGVSDSELQLRKNYIQKKLTELDFGISYYNVFNKTANKTREEPNRYLVCFAPTIQRRNEAFKYTEGLGCKCKKGNKYENHNPDGETGSTDSWTFKVDLHTVNIPKN